MKNNLFGTYEEYQLLNMISSGYSLNDFLNDMKEHMVKKAIDGTLDSDMNIAFDEAADFMKDEIRNKFQNYLTEEEWEYRQQTTDVEWAVLSRHHSDFLISNTADWVMEEYEREFGENVSLRKARKIAEKIVEDVEEDDEFNEVHAECERTYLYKRFNELESEKEKKEPKHLTFTEFLNFFDFSYTKHEDGYGFIDELGANLGGIEAERFLSPEGMVWRLYHSVYFSDYIENDENIEVDREYLLEWAENNSDKYLARIILCCDNPAFLDDKPETLDEEVLNMDIESI